MPEHPAVVFLQQAHARAEELAQAATPGPWTLDLVDETVMSESGTVARMRDWARVMTNAQVEADARLIVGMAVPTAVLCRVGAERELLADLLDEAHPSDCWVHVAADRPCDCGRDERVERRIQLLAAGWGWAEDAS